MGKEKVMTLKVKLDEGAYAPERAYSTDAGFDLRSPVDATVDARSSVTIDTGVHVQLWKNTVGFLKSKSGLNVYYGITNEGVIDCGFSGSIKVKLYNHTDVPFYVKKGSKISQLVILPIYTPDIEIVDEIEAGERGVNGFGSTGE